VGLVGLGYWGPNLLRVLFERDDVDVRWICDLDRDRLERNGRRYPAARQTQDFEAILGDPEVDAVLLATPVFTHFDLASRSLEAGKHTFVEKPLAPSRAEADRLIETASEAGLALMCGHTFLYSPPVRAVKRLIDSGEIGDIHFISSSRVNLGLHQSDVSVVWDLGPHDFSIIRYWLEEKPTTIATTGRASIVEGIPDVAFITMQFPSGIVANVELSWLAPSKLRRTVIVGSEKMVVYDDTSSEPVRVFDHGVIYKDPETFGQYQLSYRTGDILSPQLESGEPLALELSDFVASARRGEAPAGHAELARDVVDLVESAELSLEAGGAPGPAARADDPEQPRHHRPADAGGEGRYGSERGGASLGTRGRQHRLRAPQPP
jgi:predicted dehydrogenase